MFIINQKEEIGLTIKVNDKKFGNIVIAALYGQYIVDKDWVDYIVPIIEEWFDESKDEVKKSGNHDDVFDMQLKNLVDMILNRFKESEITVDLVQDQLIDFSDNENLEIINDIKTLMMHYNSWDDELKTVMDKCALTKESIKDVYIGCEEDAKFNNRSCEKFNPFVLRQSCNYGYTFNKQNECIAECPTGFYVFNDSYCLKPKIYSLNSLDKKSTECKPLHRRFAHLCVPTCPLGWEDHGSWCLRPKHEAKYYILVQ